MKANIEARFNLKDVQFLTAVKLWPAFTMFLLMGTLNIYTKHHENPLNTYQHFLITSKRRERCRRSSDQQKSSGLILFWKSDLCTNSAKTRLQLHWFPLVLSFGEVWKLRAYKLKNVNMSSNTLMVCSHADSFSLICSDSQNFISMVSATSKIQVS